MRINSSEYELVKIYPKKHYLHDLLLFKDVKNGWLECFQRFDVPEMIEQNKIKTEKHSAPHVKRHVKRHVWSESDEKKLIEMRNDNVEWCMIADHFRTTEKAVRVKHSMIKRRYK